MDIIISNTSKDPIYQQIIKQIKELVLKGELLEGDSLPSIRQLAKDLQVSVITTKRAYEELENEGFIVSIVGKGSFIASQNQELLKERRLKIIEEKICEIIDESKLIHFSKEELIELINILYGDDPE
ncbi:MULTISPECIES: GntR family transcriptional regulator [Heyndrickxia]|jgi:GntR family transcriptional regulator|uniref:GntR family transcriptional regulator n=1 Tax=Heyndrickxia oleronia TaxID=38875 RepID=A0A8E2IAN7_9BACI|nr:GntR family transcriptional regulator [Heyndrickxia oleronia]NYV66412.1 GntR family transcriptional regulator [Bacillus sp. Gen3]OJH18458.1 GntR family transcriptional regulator [Bacillus obstructivus]MBU5211392.1 GntR family transcriptional regulator [Heyndrickxia oleronia]MCI1592396.1 GntR family transcriptional regulator [Heyndrickxia oleronia]MCI1615358.1 GntR family transcriptional regulator [Heyndrickxia oleronia]